MRKVWHARGFAAANLGTSTAELNQKMAGKKYVTFKNRMLMIGCGSIGEGTIPLLLRHLDIKPEQITIITADERGHEAPKNTASNSSSSR